MSVTLLPNRTLDQIETVPKVVPTTGEDIFVSDIHAVEIVLTNDGPGTAHVTITDKQSTPLALVSGKAGLMSGATAIFEFSGRLCPGGVNWVSDAAGVVGYVRGY